MFFEGPRKMIKTESDRVVIKRGDKRYDLMLSEMKLRSREDAQALETRLGSLLEKAMAPHVCLIKILSINPTRYSILCGPKGGRILDNWWLGVPAPQPGLRAK